MPVPWVEKNSLYIYISLFYSPFSDRVGLPLITLIFRGVNEEYWSSVFDWMPFLPSSTCMG